MNTLLLTLFAAVRLSLAAPLGTQLACPTDVPLVRSGVRALVADARIRSAAGLSAVNPDSLRLLTDAADASVCRTLKERYVASPTSSGAVPRWVYYKAGGFYFAGVISVDASGRPLPRKGDLWIFDSSLTPKARYML